MSRAQVATSRETREGKQPSVSPYPFLPTRILFPRNRTRRTRRITAMGIDADSFPIWSIILVIIIVAGYLFFTWRRR